MRLHGFSLWRRWLKCRGMPQVTSGFIVLTFTSRNETRIHSFYCSVPFSLSPSGTGSWPSGGWNHFCPPPLEPWTWTRISRQGFSCLWIEEEKSYLKSILEADLELRGLRFSLKISPELKATGIINWDCRTQWNQNLLLPGMALLFFLVG